MHDPLTHDSNARANPILAHLCKPGIDV